MRTILAVLFLSIVLVFSVGGQTASKEKLNKAIYLEEVSGELQKAIQEYEKIIKDYPDEREVAATAQFHIGLCYEKQGLKQAKLAYQKVLDDYPEQKDKVEQARLRLNGIKLVLAEEDVVPPLNPKFTRINIPTELAWSVKLSPDGSSFIQVSDDQLWKVPVKGTLGVGYAGTPVKISTADKKPDRIGLAWSKNGKWIAFNGQPEASSENTSKGNQSIYVVSSKGGTPKKVYENYRDQRTVNYRIDLSPNGEKFAFSMVDTHKEEQHIYIVPVQGGQAKRLTEMQSREPVFSPDGKIIAFVEDKNMGRGGGGIYTISAGGGIPVLIAEAVNASCPVWSPKGDMIAYLDYGAEKTQIYFAPIGRDGKVTGDILTFNIPEEFDGIWELAGWSPDNKIPAIFSKGGTTGLYTMPVKGGKAVQIAIGCGQPRWSPDNKRIYCVGGTKKKNNGWKSLALGFIPAEGGDFEAIPIHSHPKMGIPGFGSGHNLSPDGKKIVFSGKTENKPPVFMHNNIWMVPTKGGKPVQLTKSDKQFTHMFPCWSPDGNIIAYINAKMPERITGLTDVKANVKLLDLNSRTVSSLTNDSDSVAFGPIEWSPDGEYIAFLSMDYTTSSETANLKLISLNGEKRTKSIAVIENVHPGIQFSWSPDGARIVFLGGDGKIIRSISIEDGSSFNQETGLVNSVLGDRIDWSPDGKNFVFVAGEGETNELWLLEDFLPHNKLTLKGKSKAIKEHEGIIINQVWSGKEADNTGTISHDGKYLSFVDWSTGDLALRDLETGTNRRLTNEGSYDEKTPQFAHNSIFSPSCKQIVYAWLNPNTYMYEVRMLDIDNPVPRVLYSREKESVFPACWLPDGKSVIAQCYFDNNKTKIIVINTGDGSNKVVKSFDREQQMRLCLSKDGSYLLYDALEDHNGENHDIHMVSLDGSYETTLISHPADDRILGRIPGSDELLFTSNRAGTHDIWSARIVKGKVSGLPARIVPEAGQISPMGITQDGSLFCGVFTRHGTGLLTSFDKKTGIKSAGNPKHKYLSGSVMCVEWSPNGESLACVKEHHKVDDYFSQLHIFDVESGRDHGLCNNLRIHNSIRWSPDGSKILAVGFDEKQRGYDDYRYRGGIYEISVETGLMSELVGFHGMGDDQGTMGITVAEWSRDGKSIYYLHADPAVMHSHRVIKRELKTGKEQVLYEGERFTRVLRLNPETNELLIAYKNPGTRKVHICSLPTDGGQLQEICTSQDTERISTAIWSLDGKQVYFTERPEWDQSKLWRVSVADKKPVTVCELPHLDARLSIHPSGDKAAICYGIQSTEIREIKNIQREIEKVYSYNK